ncbi:MAG: GTPase [Planctomycetota bacterium]
MNEGLTQLQDDLTAVSFVPGTESAADYEALLSRTARLLRVKLTFESRRAPDAAPFVVIAGGTNVGKSTVFNWLVGEKIGSSSPLARHTKAPTIYVPRSELPNIPEGVLLPSYARMTLERPEDAAHEVEGEAPVSYFLRLHENPEAAGRVLIDSPDIDSTHDRNRRVAEDLLFLADQVVFVSTPEKYNDELCVRYLKRAVELQKGLTCVLNKGADKDVEQDFLTVVVPGLGGKAATICLPYEREGPSPTTDAPYRGELRQLVFHPQQDAQDLRQRALSGACVSLGRDLSQVTSRLREELSELDRIRAEVDLVLEARRDDYVAFLRSLEFYELDRVFERLMREFRIPVLDSVYDGVRGALGFMGTNLTRLVSGRQSKNSKQSKLEARAEVDRQKVKELFESARADVTELPYIHAGTMRQAVPGWVATLGGVSVEQSNAEVDAFTKQAEAETERWVEDETRRHVELLNKHPLARNSLRAMKGFLQIGFGLISAHLTGGLGPWDLLIGTATERATKVVLESAGGHLHYQSMKKEFTQKRGALFLESLRATVGRQLVEHLPPGVDPARLERLDHAAASLGRGELP